MSTKVDKVKRIWKPEIRAYMGLVCKINSTLIWNYRTIRIILSYLGLMQCYTYLATQRIDHYSVLIRIEETLQSKLRLVSI